MSKTVKVKWRPEPKDGPILDMASVRIEIDEDHPDDVWIWMIEDGVKVEGGRFPLADLLAVILKYYNKEY